jgi:hypothetical protein
MPAKADQSLLKLPLVDFDLFDLVLYQISFLIMKNIIFFYASPPFFKGGYPDDSRTGWFVTENIF